MHEFRQPSSASSQIRPSGTSERNSSRQMSVLAPLGIPAIERPSGRSPADQGSPRQAHFGCVSRVHELCGVGVGRGQVDNRARRSWRICEEVARAAMSSSTVPGLQHIPPISRRMWRHLEALAHLRWGHEPKHRLGARAAAPVGTGSTRGTRPRRRGQPAAARTAGYGFTERRKRPVIANVAIARELAGWCWSLAVMDD